MIAYRYTIGNTTTETCDLQSVPNGVVYQTIEIEIQSNAETIPAEVTAIKFLVQLELEGVTEANILSIINTLPEPNKTIANVSFKRATLFERTNPLLSLVGQAYGFNEAKLDEIFINANKLPI